MLQAPLTQWWHQSGPERCQKHTCHSGCQRLGEKNQRVPLCIRNKQILGRDCQLKIISYDDCAWAWITAWWCIRRKALCISEDVRRINQPCSSWSMALCVLRLFLCVFFSDNFCVFFDITFFVLLFEFVNKCIPLFNFLVSVRCSLYNLLCSFRSVLVFFHLVLQIVSYFYFLCDY